MGSTHIVLSLFRYLFMQL